MKTFLLVFLFLFSTQSFTQEIPFSNRCGMIGNPSLESSPSTFIGGRWKPHRTDIGGSNPDGPVMNALLVFVEFDDETIDGSEQGWIAGEEPLYMNELLSPSYDSRPDYWNAYDNYLLSKYCCDVSRGSLHIVGKTIYVKLAHTEQWYSQQFSGTNALYYRNAMINKEIYDYVKNEVDDLDWPKYDQWKFNNDGNFSHIPDEKLDMMIKVHRTITIDDENSVIVNSMYVGMGFLGPVTEIATVVDNYEMYNQGGRKIIVDKNFSGTGSGMTLNGRKTPVSKELVLDVGSHEYGHYLMGSTGHFGYAKMGGGGYEFGFSPREMIKLDFIRPKIADYSSPYNTLGDYSSRNGSSGTEGEILKVHINQISEDDDEYFLIANRRRFSFTDFRMWGDTLPHESHPFKQVNPDYGKGIYIYHNNLGLVYPSGDLNNYVDLECADGLWDWEYGGRTYLAWDETPEPVLKHSAVSYKQDLPNGSLAYNKSKDQINAQINYPLNSSTWYNCWFSPGKTHNPSNIMTGGIDRVYSNDKDYWYSLASYGDRWDAWNIGYNQVFSPYSSPNTNDWGNKPSGIFIYYEELDRDQNAIIKVYRVGEGGYDEEMILEATPPSKPMGITSSYYFETENLARPMITWLPNREPDMVRTDGTSHYQIYRAVASGMTVVPANYVLIDELEFSTEINQPLQFIDYSIIGQPSYWPGLGDVSEYPVRYHVVAVDKYETSSVSSDFADAIGLVPDEGGHEKDGLGRPSVENENYNKGLSQNYPNPFNPTTKISYELSNKELVILKVYDILGKEVNILVNEVKEPGKYSIDFDGSNLSTGVYFYTLITGNNIITKKMFLMK